MGWEQIESKWAAMTQRVGGMNPSLKVNARAATARLLVKTETLAGTGAGLASSETPEANTTMSAQ